MSDKKATNELGPDKLEITQWMLSQAVQSMLIESRWSDLDDFLANAIIDRCGDDFGLQDIVQNNASDAGILSVLLVCHPQSNSKDRLDVLREAMQLIGIETEVRIAHYVGE